MEKKKSPVLSVGMHISAAMMQNRMEVLQKTKNRVAISLSNPAPGHISGENYNSKRYMHL